MRRLTFLAAAAAIAAVLPSPASAQAQARIPGVRGDFIATYSGVARKFQALAEAFPADKYGWTPGKGVRTVCEVFTHIAAENYDMGKAFGGPDAPKDLATVTTETCLGDKAKVQAALKASFETIDATVRNMKDSSLEEPFKLFGMTQPRRAWLLATAEHSGEHLGQLIAYARMVQIVPPWSK